MAAVNFALWYGGPFMSATAEPSILCFCLSVWAAVVRSYAASCIAPSGCAYAIRAYVLHDMLTCMICLMMSRSEGQGVLGFTTSQADDTHALFASRHVTQSHSCCMRVFVISSHGFDAMS